MQEETRKGSPLDLVYGIWTRRKWLAVLVFVAPFASVVTLAKFLPSIYQSTVTVLVERQQVPEAFVRTTVTSELPIRLQTITQEALSRSRLEALITRFNLYPEFRRRLPLEEVIGRMRDDVKVELKGAEGHAGGPAVRRGGAQETVAFSISYRGSDPQTVAQVTNTLASFFIEENLKVRERQATGTAEFLKVQLEGAKKRLDSLERLVSDFKKRFIGELPEQMQANLVTLERLNTQLRLNNDNQNRAIERREALAKQLANGESLAPLPGPPGSPAVVPDSPAMRLARLRQELTGLRTRFTDRHPTVLRTEAEIAALERQLADRTSDAGTAPDPSVPASPQVLRQRQALGDAEAEIKVLKAEEKNLRDAIATYQRRVENAPRREQEFQELSRDYETTKTLYRTLLSRYEEAQLAESLEQRQKGEQFRILDPAIPSGVPAAPKRPQFLLIGLVFSLGLAVGAAVLAEQLNTSFHTVEDLRSFTAVPVLVSIPKIITRDDTRRRRRRFRRVAVAAMLGLAIVVGTSYFIAHGNQELVRMMLGKASPS